MSKFLDPTTVVDVEAFQPYGIKHRVVTEDGNEFHHTQVDATPFLLRNEVLRQEQGNRWGNEPKVLANLPMNVYLDLEKRGITKDPKRLRAWLKENSAFKAFERADK